MKKIIIITLLSLTHICGYSQNFTVLNSHMEYKSEKVNVNKSNENSDLGWKLLFENKISVAEQRFKRAYSLNKNNMNAVWGMGIINLNKEKFDVALQLFDEAYVVLNKNENFIVDYAKALSVIAINKKNEQLLYKSLNLFEQIYNNNKENTYNLQNWAITLMLTGNVNKAVLLVDEAKKTKNAQVLDKDFLNELEKLKK